MIRNRAHILKGNWMLPCKTWMKGMMAMVFLSFFFKGGEAQDVHFSQFRLAPLVLNPSTAGNFPADFRAHLNFKNQWQSLGNPYRTFAFAGDGKLLKDKIGNGQLGVGLSAFSDKAGDGGFGTTRANLAVSYGLYITEKQILSGGIQVGYDQKSVDKGALKWESQYDGTGHNSDLPSQEDGLQSKSSAIDVGGGLNWRLFSEDNSIYGNNSYWFDVGVAVHHLARPDHSFYENGSEKTDIKGLLHADGLLRMGNTGLDLMPGLMYARQGPHQEILLGTFIRYQFKNESEYTGYRKGASVAFGLHHRWKDAVIASLRYEIAQYTIGVSYDLNVSGLRTATSGRGGVEAGFRFLAPDPYTSKPASPRF